MSKLKAQIDRLDVDRIEWTPTGTPGVFERILNVDRQTGARTLLLKSLPRPKAALVDRRPQVHPVDEEFYCLSGRFTLEGNVWFGEHSYVYYPPNLVHGYDVDVPGGYEIYLRNSGPISTQRVDHPTSPSLHFAGRDSPAPPHVTIFDGRAEIHRLHDRQTMSVIPLRKASRNSEGALVLNLPAGARATFAAAGPTDHLEMFVLAGDMQIGDRARLPGRSYSCLHQGAPIQLVGLDAASTILINYSNVSVLDHIVERTAAAATDAVPKPCS